MEQTPVGSGQPWGDASTYGQPVEPSQYGEYGQPAPPPHRRRHLKLAAGAAAMAAAVAIGFGVSAAMGGGTSVVSGQGHEATSGSNALPAAAAQAAGEATSAEEVGVVDILTVLKYQGGEAAGTGMILTSSGEVLTNNHVVEGATSIKVTVVSTGKTYTATVVGTDPTDDIAVLQLKDASGLQTVKTGDSSAVSAGDAVTAVGNAGGVGGTPSAATGSVVATGQPLTASDENGSNAETLTDMIEINADVQSGDSGGPLYDSSGKVIGMDTAASSSRFGQTTIAYAIPIDRALTVAAQIESGKETSTIHIGAPAFLGVGMADSLNGPVVTGVASGSPAAQAGLSAGDVITSIGGTKVDSAAGVASAITAHNPGDHVTITWTDTSGNSHSASVNLIEGPAD